MLLVVLIEGTICYYGVLHGVYGVDTPDNPV